MKETRFDVLAKCYRELADSLRKIDHELVQNLIKSWELSFAQIEAFLVSNQVTKSQVVSGLKEGLKDLFDLFNDLPSPEREVALKVLNETLARNGVV